MPLGRIRRLVHLSQQTFLPNTRLVPDHNDKGYGVIEASDGREVFFPPEAVESRSGFEDVRKDQFVEYTLEAAPYLRAKWVKPPVNLTHGVAPWPIPENASYRAVQAAAAAAIQDPIMMSKESDKITSAVKTCLFYAERSPTPETFFSEFILLLRNDPAWSAADVDQVERAVADALGLDAKEHSRK